MRQKILLFLLLVCFGVAQAKDEPIQGEVNGPAKVTLGDNLATLALPEGFVFYDQKLTDTILKESGNLPDGNELGCVFLQKENESFWVVISFEEIGYVKDDEAGEIDADALLEDFRQGTEAANVERAKQGVAALELVGWGQEPRYDSTKHHLVWALKGKGSDGEVVNFNTRVLGRKGVLSLNLICDPADLERYKPKLESLLTKTNYVEGQRYADFQEGDQVAEVGLLALIAGGAAAAKLGFFAKIGKFLLYLLVVGKKFIVLFVIAAFGLVKRFFSGGSAQPEEVVLPSQEPESPPSDPPSSMG